MSLYMEKTEYKRVICEKCGCEYPVRKEPINLCSSCNPDSIYDKNSMLNWFLKNQEYLFLQDLKDLFERSFDVNIDFSVDETRGYGMTIYVYKFVMYDKSGKKINTFCNTFSLDGEEERYMDYQKSIKSFRSIRQDLIDCLLFINDHESKDKNKGQVITSTSIETLKKKYRRKIFK